MHKITIIGNVGREPKVGTTSKGNQYLSFVMASNYYANGENKTQWFSVNWFDPAPNILKLKMGSTVVVTGNLDLSITVNPTTNKNYVDAYVIADSVSFLSIGSQGTNTAKSENAAQQTATESDTDPALQVTKSVKKAPTKPEKKVEVTPVAPDDDLPF